MTARTDAGAPLVLVSNRGPVTYQDDGSMKRGAGGLATALIGLASHRHATWIASAMSVGDTKRAQERDGRPFEISAPGGGEFDVRFVSSDPTAYDAFYNIIANPMLWFIQHYLWDLSNAPDIRRHEVEAFEHGYKVVNQDLADAVLEEIEGVEEPVVMVHDYQLYLVPEMVRSARPDAFLHHFIHIPWSQPDSWRVLPTAMRDQIEWLDIASIAIRRLLRSLAEEARAAHEDSAALMDLLAGELAIELARYFAAVEDLPLRGGLAPWRLRLIDERLKVEGPPPELAELAATCGLSVRQLTRGYRTSRGCTVGDTIAHDRIETAKRMLHGDHSIKALARILGFATTSSFAVAFRRATALTPRQFRQRIVRPSR